MILWNGFRLDPVKILGTFALFLYTDFGDYVSYKQQLWAD